MNLNEQQKKAVEHTKGPLMILAGAGSGKTRVITERIAHLIQTGIAPNEILALTFTNKAANEMKERVADRLGSTPAYNRPIHAKNTPYVTTFHSLGVALLREYAHHIGIKKHFTIFDRADSIRVIKRVLKQLSLDPKQFEPRVVLGKISRQKANGVSHGDYSIDISDTYRHTINRIWEHYESELKKESALDFDDLLLKTSILLRNNPDVQKHLHQRWAHIHIDEYQDTNLVQFEITKLLVGKEANICVVGDIDQVVYSWRGANIGNLLTFEEEFPGTTLIKLEQNYRSTKKILDAANVIIEKNVRRKEKKLFTENADGEDIALYSAYSEDDEARFVVSQCAELIQNGVKPKDIAVLYRANYQSRVLEQHFLDSQIPYQVLGVRFFERAEVKDILSYIRASLNPDAQGDIARIVSTPPRGIGKMTLSKMLLHKENELTPAAQKKVVDFKTLLARIQKTALAARPSETIQFVVKESGLEKKLLAGGEEDHERLENIKELATLAKKYDEMPPEAGIEKLLEDASLATDQDSLQKNTNSVTLMTVHAAKGLEFDYVFIVGLEEGLFPHESMDENTDDEEERRLFYVALTRARVRVSLSHAVIRTIFGSQSIQVISSFIEDIGLDAMDILGEHKPPHERGVDLIDF